MTRLNGWNGQLLNVDLEKAKAVPTSYPPELAATFIGGRGFAIKTLWNEVKAGTDPFSPENVLVIATGALSGHILPSSAKMIVATKGPLTGGYAEGSIGTYAASQLKKAGYDHIVVRGRASEPSIIVIHDQKVEILPSEDLWGLGTRDAEKKLKDAYGRTVGTLLIGPAGEHRVRFASVFSMGGRSGGRPGVGAVMGSKNLKAIVVNGSGEIPAAHPEDLKKIGSDASRKLLAHPKFKGWKGAGTISIVDRAQLMGILPTFNFREGSFDGADGLNEAAMKKIKIEERGCPICTITCGQVVHDQEDEHTELDYENVAMLGSNIGLSDLAKVSVLNRMADDNGFDAISLGSVIGFAMECSEKKLISERIEWGNFDHAKTLVDDILHRRGIGDQMAEGTRNAAAKIGGYSSKWAMHVKGLEISAYDCHAFPLMALAFSTSPIGAHHKDGWVLGWEATVGKNSDAAGKVDRLMELQRLSTGIECFSVCRFPWSQFEMDIGQYLTLYYLITDTKMSVEELRTISDRIYSLIRAFWVREYGSSWTRMLDEPPARWFEDPTSRGPTKGATLSRDGYNELLDLYYAKRGWNSQGVPIKATLESLGIGYVADSLNLTN
jgi:aldehyde:ferredoxin oxidoreductase